MEVVIILLLILFNGFLSMSEIALVSSRKSRLESDAKQGNKSAQRALNLANNPDKFLSTIQIGITLVGVLTGMYSGEAWAEDLARWIGTSSWEWLTVNALWLAKTFIVVVVTFLTLILGELVPKRIGMNYAEKVSKFMVGPMRALAFVAAPFVWLLSVTTRGMTHLFGLHKSDDSKVTEEEIKAIIQEGKEDGEVQEVEQEIVERVFNLGDRDIETIMTHRNDLTWLDVNASVEELRSTINESIHSIYPVADEDLDNVIGIVYLKDLWGKIDETDFSLRSYVKVAKYVPENQSVYGIMELFKKEHLRSALVADEFGCVQGIVTITDILEGLVGEFSEVGEEADIVSRGDGSYLVDGQCDFYDFLEFFEREDLYQEHDYNTLSGLILDILEHIPVTGEHLSWQDFDFEIVDMDAARIDKVLVQKKRNNADLQD